MISVYWDKVVPLTWGLREPRTFLWPPTLQTQRGKGLYFLLVVFPHIFLIFLNQAGSVTWWRRATPSSSKLHWRHRGAGLGSLTLPTSQCSFQFVSEHLHFCLKSLSRTVIFPLLKFNFSQVSYLSSIGEKMLITFNRVLRGDNFLLNIIKPLGILWLLSIMLAKIALFLILCSFSCIFCC